MSAAVRRRRSDESGQAAGVEMVPFGILLVVGGVLLATHAWAVVDTRAALDAAARDYLRAYTAAPGSAAGRLAGRDAARASLGSRERGAAVEIEDPSTPFGPCRPATVRLDATLPAVHLPFVGELGSVTVTATQTELVQPYGRAHDEPDAIGPVPC